MNTTKQDNIDTETKKYKIYFLMCPFSNEIRYIGITSMNIEKRLAYHIREKSKNNPYKFRWIQKLKRKSLAPKIKAFKEGLSRSDACKEEIRLISAYRKALGDKLTNIHEGGNLPPVHKGKNNPMYGSSRSGKKNPFYGRKHSDASKQKMRQAHKGKTLTEKQKQALAFGRRRPANNKGENNPMYGRRHSESTKEKIRKTKKSKSIIQKSIDEKIIKEWSSIKLASRMTGVNDSSIIRVCKKKQRTAGGFVWQYKEDIK